MNDLRKSILPVFAASFFLITVASVILYLFLGKIKSSIIVHFDVFKGILNFGGFTDALGIIILSVAILLLNLFLSLFLFNRERFLSYTFALCSLAFSILILISIAVIISVN